MGRARDRASADLNGQEFILDADADTSISADTDDQIDIKIAGADDFQFTANTFTAQSGSTIAAQALTATTITASGVVDVTDTTDASDATGDTGALRTEGGVSIAKKLYVGTDLSAAGDISFDGGNFVFNESSADVDFRLESDSQGHAFFLEGSTSLVGIGVSNPADYNSYGNGLVIDRSETSGSSGITLVSATDGYGSIYFSDATGNVTHGAIEYGHGADLLKIKTASAERLNIDASGFISHIFTSDNSTTAEGLFINNRQNSTGNNASLIFSNDSGARKKAAIAHIDTGSYGSGNLIFAIDGADSGAVHLTNDEKIRITSSGYLHIGGADTSVDNSAYFEDAGNLVIRRGSDSNATMLSFINGGSLVGRISTSTTATTYHTSSDYRLKENVTYDWDATSRLKQLKPARFNFKIDEDTTVDGFLAHEVSDIVPEAIVGVKDETQDLGTIKNEEGNIVQENVLEAKTKKDEGQTWTKTKTENVYQGIDQSKLVPLLVKTIQELEARVTALESA